MAQTTVVPIEGPYEPVFVEVDWEEIDESAVEDPDAILMVAEDEEGNSRGTYIINDPDTTVPQFLEFIEAFVVDRFDLAGSILLIVEE